MIHMIAKDAAPCAFSSKMILSLLTFCVAFMPSVLQVILHFLLVTNSLGQRIHNGTHHSWSEEVQGNETTLGRSTNATTWIPGTYVYISSDNFESYLKGLDVSYFLRKLALLARPVVSIHSQVNNYCIAIVNGFLYLKDKKTKSIVMQA